MPEPSSAPATHGGGRTKTPATKITRLSELVTSGMPVKDAAKEVGMGYSTALHHLQMRRKQSPPGKALKVTKYKGLRLTPEQINIIEQGVRAKAPPSEIAQTAGCHVSSVYTYRKRLENDGEVLTSETPVHEGMPLGNYNEFKYANKKTWDNVNKEGREPTDGELYWTIAWRRYNSRD